MQKTNIFCSKKNHSFFDPCQKRTPKGVEMAPQKARNDPNMLKIPKIFDFYHEIIRLKFLYRGSTKDPIRIVLRQTAFYVLKQGFWVANNNAKILPQSIV